ncbi:MAG: NAD-binding protein [Salinisphaeraceae bacterium]|nr:NAD-binding protein [Salinisphaeraceae bacterium]
MATQRKAEDSALSKVLFLFFRRMRAPLIVLISAYSISIGGLVLIPGVDENGNVWRFDFFHAFYFVSFMGSTIGFGEIPHAFSAAQRLWVAFCIFFTVIAWLYAIGRIFSLMQDPAFSRATTEARFIMGVRQIRQPFTIVCGYGETGSLLVRAMAHRGMQCVVLDKQQTNIDSLLLENLGMDIPAFCADASVTRHLLEAGIRKSLCRGVVAITDSDSVNVKIAVTAKLLKPGISVIARAGIQESVDNLASFNTDHIINAYEVFGEHLAMTQRTPSVHLLHAWLISLPKRELHPPVTPPKGNWVVCGYGRFGSSCARYLEAEGNNVQVIESNTEKAPDGAVVGRGTEAGPLLEAGIRDAVGIVVGADSDTNTLSALITARELNPELYLVARQDRRADTEIFQAADIDLIMEPSRIIVWRILPLLYTPLLSRFLRLLRQGTEADAQDLIDRIREMCGGVTPETWSFEVAPESATALYAAIDKGEDIRISHILSTPTDRSKPLPCIALLLNRGEKNYMLPDPDMQLQRGDRIVLTARHGTRTTMDWLLYNPKALEYAVTGNELPDGSIWRWLAKRRDNSKLLSN